MRSWTRRRGCSRLVLVVEERIVQLGSGKIWVKYSTPNISRRIGSGNILGSIGY